jgi:hypothetical protein
MFLVIAKDVLVGMLVKGPQVTQSHPKCLVSKIYK